MAEIYLRNHREHDITLNINDQSVTIPGGRMAPEGAGGFAPGLAKIDADLLKAGKSHPVIEAYFDEGYLSIAEPSKPAKATKAKEETEQ